MIKLVNHGNDDFGVRLSLKNGRAKYSVDDFMKDLISNQVDKLNLEYRYGCSSRNFPLLDCDSKKPTASSYLILPLGFF